MTVVVLLPRGAAFGGRPVLLLSGPAAVSSPLSPDTQSSTDFLELSLLPLTWIF
jgi:hypothetical protein